MKIKVIGPEAKSPEPKKIEEKKAEGKEKELKKEKTSSVVKKSSASVAGGVSRVFLSIILAVGAYFTARHYLPKELPVFLLELASLIISLLVLRGISIAYGGKDNKIGGAVTVIMIAIFIWQLFQAYADYSPPPVRQDQGQVGAITEVRTLYPQAEPYVFHLKEKGDETPYFKPPTGGLYMFNYSSHDYGYEIIFNDGTIYQGNPNRPIPEKTHPVIKIRATSPNQFVNVRISNR